MATAAPKKSFIGALRNNKGWAVNFVISQLLFWLIGFRNVTEYGWNSENFDENGAIPSGVEGSGAFVITLFFAALSMVVWGFYVYLYYVDEDEESHLD